MIAAATGTTSTPRRSASSITWPIGLKEPYWVFGGLQDNGSWGGPAISKNGGIINEDWLSVGGGDGFVCRVDANDPDLVYSESQNGTINRRHLKTGERAAIRPVQRPRGTPPYRFNWNTPFLLSNHNSKIFYSAGNFVFRSLDRGNNLQPISPEITLTKRGSATALAESPRNRESALCRHRRRGLVGDARRRPRVERHHQEPRHPRPAVGGDD